MMQPKTGKVLGLSVLSLVLVSLVLFTREHCSNHDCQGYIAELSNSPGRRVETKGDSRPRMIYQGPCEGSTSVQGMARKLMAAHGNPPARTPFEPFNFKEKESIDKVRPQVFRNMSFTAKLSLFLDDADQLYGTHGINHGRPVVFKKSSLVLNEPVLDVLQTRGTLAVAILRRNSLDKLICSIRDCFAYMSRNSGYSVDEMGRPSKLCFERRKTKTKTTRTSAFIKSDSVLPVLNSLRSANDKMLPGLQRWGFRNADLLSTEDLFDFEWSNRAEDLARAVNGWSRVLRAWGMEPNAGIIHDYLQKYCGTRKQSSHKHTIYNFDDVSKALEGTQFSSMLRHEDFVQSNPNCKCC